MRYLGNKESLLDEIKNLFHNKKLLNSSYIFFDAFCGTGTVSDYFKNTFHKYVINDNLLFATTYSAGRLKKNDCTFSSLNFNPIVFFNSNKNVTEGFFYNNYAPLKSGRMYFSNFNAGRIDYFRQSIEEWLVNKKIKKNEYYYLLACLLESVSKVANVAGVYGAYLKKWDPRALKEIKFLEVPSFDSSNKINLKHYNENLKDIIQKIDCDILYLDPPYTKNKYSVQYHLLETLIKNDNPELKGITGTRDLSHISQSWSNPYEAEIEFDYIFSKTNARYIVLSYSSDGIMSKEFILNVFKRYCKKESIFYKEISYKKYRNKKTHTTNEHFEYLFYGEKIDSNLVPYYCPLNYMGGKTNIIHFIKPHLNAEKIIDIMGGGFNVGINSIHAKEVIYNDINYIVKDLIQMFKTYDTKNLLKQIEKIIHTYKLEKHNKETYLFFRQEYNKKFRFQNDYTIYLYTLILYGFQQQLRFNSNYEFNNPVGESGYNDSIKEKIISFSRRIKELNVSFISSSYELLLNEITNKTLVYFDPPYLITLGSYNDGKRGFIGWNEDEEKKLISFFNKAKQKKCILLISNILEYKGKENNLLKKWIYENNPTVQEITIRGRKEVLLKL